MISCSECGSTNDESAKFCQECGMEIVSKSNKNLANKIVKISFGLADSSKSQVNGILKKGKKKKQESSTVPKKFYLKLIWGNIPLSDSKLALKTIRK